MIAEQSPPTNAPPRGEPTAPSPKPFVLDHISPTSMKTYFGCSLRFYFEKVQQLPRPVSPSLHLGKAVHEGLRAFHLARWRDGASGEDAVVAAYQAAFAALEVEEGPVEWSEPAEKADALASGERVIRAYLASDHARLEGKPLGVEVILNDHVPELELPLTGVIDLVRPGHVPVDFKTVAATTGNLELETFLHETQLVAYQLLLEAATGEPVTALELVYLVKTKSPKVLVHRIPPADETRKLRFAALAEAYVAGVRAERFHPQPGVHCAWCSFRNECRAWKGGPS
jgi:putative RecB family exonuclease